MTNLVDANCGFRPQICSENGEKEFIENGRRSRVIKVLKWKIPVNTGFWKTR